MAIDQYRLISFDKQMNIGVTGSMQVTLSAVAKTNNGVAPYCVANELICAELGRYLRIPVPPCGIVRPSNQPTPIYFASMDFNLTGNSLPPVDPAACVAASPHLCTGTLLYDVLIANCDRHSGNFALDRSSNPPRLVVFDHSHALFGFQDGRARNRLQILRDRLGVSGGTQTHGNRHCLLDVLQTDDHFADWLDRINALPDYLVEGLCEDAKDLGVTSEEADEARDFLKHRRDTMKTIIDSNRSEFTAITQWSLFA